MKADKLRELLRRLERIYGDCEGDEAVILSDLVDIVKELVDGLLEGGE